MDTKLVKQFNSNTSEIAKIQSEISKATIAMTSQLEELQVKDSELRVAIKESMKKYDIKKFEDEHISIVYIAPSTRTILDSVKIKAEAPEIFNKYSKQSQVSESIRIKVKEMK